MEGRKSAGWWGIPASWWGKTAVAGLFAGIVMMAYEMVACWVKGVGPWEPLNLIGATFGWFRPVSVQFGIGSTLSGLGLHLAISMVWGLIYGVVAGRAFPGEARSLSRAFILGMGFGLLAWIVSGVDIGTWVDPSLRTLDPLVYAIGHLIFGIVTALGVALWARDDELRFLSITFAPNQLESMIQARSERKSEEP